MLSKREMASYGLGAVGKDMVYMFSASYILYYYQDILGVSAIAMGMILMAARVFDAFNDPVMGVIVAKTIKSISSFCIFARSIAIKAAFNAKSEVNSSLAAILRSEMPVRLIIHSSVVSTIVSSSSFVRTFCGAYAPMDLKMAKFNFFSLMRL